MTRLTPCDFREQITRLPLVILKRQGLPLVILGGKMTRLTPCDFRGGGMTRLTPCDFRGGGMTRLTPCNFREKNYKSVIFRAKINKAYPL